MHFLFFAIIPIFFSACNSMSKKQCQNANWRSIGYEDGFFGRDADFFTDYRDSPCSKTGFGPDRKAYIEGRDVGLKSFCTYENGISFGENDKYYQDVCPQSLEKDFMRGYELGKARYKLRIAEEERRKIQEESEKQKQEEDGLNQDL